MNIILRVDGNQKIGLGHFKRCVALAHELSERKYNPIFVMKECDEALKEEARGFGSEPEFINDDSEMIKIITSHNVKIVVVDCSHEKYFSKPEQFAEMIRSLKKAGVFVVVIDGGTPLDYISAKIDVPADMVVCPYVGIEKKEKVLAGPQYFIFRREFLTWRETDKKFNSEVKNVLVTLGGADPLNLTPKVVQALIDLDYKGEVKVILGLNVASEKVVKDLVESRKNFEVIKNCFHMADMFHNADLAVLGSGLTKYEAALMGVPSIVMIGPDYQVSSKGFEQTGVCEPMKVDKDTSVKDIAKVINKVISSEKLREGFFLKGQALCDASGIGRIIEEMEKRLKHEEHYCDR